MRAQCHVSDVAAIEDAFLSYASLDGWVEAGQGQEFVDLLRAVWRTRAYGDFWSYMLLAEGGVDIACEPELELYDMAACAVVVSEAGGQFTDLDGRPGPLGAGRLRHQRSAARRGAGAALGSRDAPGRVPVARRSGRRSE